MKLSSSDRKSLIKLAGTLPKGSAERRAILAGLKVASADRKAPQGYRYAVRFDSSDYVLQSEKEAYDRGYSDGFNDFPIEPEMMGRNGGRNHPFYRDYMDGFDEGNRDARRGGGVRSAERRAILAGLSKTAAIPTGLPGVSSFINYSSGSVPREAQEKIWKAVSAMLAHAGGVQNPSGRQEFIGVRFGPGDQLYGKDGDGLSFWFNLTGNLVKGQGAARVLAPALNVPASAIRVGYKWSKGGFGVRDGHGEWALSENLFTVSIGKRGLKAGFRFW